MASSLSPASLKRIRQELKEWEHTFHRLHGRSPSKDDIKASPSIHDLYKQYACLKLKLQAQSSKHTENCKPSIDSRKKTSLQGLENPDSLVWARPSSPATKSSCSDGSQGTHISATPPRKKAAFICTPGDVSSRDAQTGAHNLSLCSLEVCRPALCEIASNSAVSKNNHEGKDLPGVLFQASSRSVACKNLNSVGENTTAKQTFSEETCKLGFTIKLQRYGERNKENLEVENIPAGFCLNPVSSFRHAAKPLSRRILARQPDTGSADTASFVDMQVTATELQALEKSSHAHLCDQKKASFALSDSANNMNVSDAVSSRLPIYEGDSDKNKIIRDTEALDLLKLTVPSLRRLALDQGLPSSGSKSELISHLTQTSSEAGCVGNMTERKDQSNSTSNWSKNLSVGGALCQEGLEEMTVAALRKLLTSKGLRACGNKAALVSRLLQDTTSSTDSRKPRGVLELPTGTCKRKSEYEEEACTGNEGILGRSALLHRQLQGSETLQSHSGQKLGRRSAFQNNHSESFASKKSKATVEFINWHSVHKSDCLIKKSGVRQNFVKLNIGKRGNKSHRFVNTALKRKLGAGKRRFKSYSKRKLKKSLAANMEDDIECYGEDGSAYDLVGNLLEQASSPGLNVNSPQAHLTHSAAMGDVQQADSSGNTLAHGNWDCASASLTLAAAEALESPTEENLHKVLHLLFGYKSFRPGQLETIQQILAGQSTMVVLPTGAGKSLSYQLPAFLLPGLTLVISPLVAVMVDQLQHLPPVLSGAFLSSIQTSREYSSILNRLHLGQLKVLFVSPERLICDKFLSLLEGLPRISLAVVDEAHCLSEWSHNFRPSYYRLGVILRQKLNLNCVLAMTATATKRTLESIMQSLSIAPNNLVQGSSVRRNVICTASWSENRCKDLLSVLRSSPFRDARSIIVYCNFQFEADNVSLVLRDNGIDAKSYHGGMSPTDRKRTQELFCNNKLRVVVATVAFGLGLDKSDVNAVIHYGLPNSVEHYVQETGRAGRNGDPAHCHLLLDNTNYLKLRSLAFSDNVDVPAISSLLSKIFSETSLQSMSCQIQSIPIESTTKDLDLKEEVMATTLSYLEVGDIQYVSVLPQLKTTCTLQFHKNSPTLLARNSLLIDAVMKMSREKLGEYSFELPSVANYMGLKLPDLHQQLQDLQVAGEVSFTLKSPAFCFHVLKVPEDLSALELKITECFAKMEHLKVKKLDFMFQTASNLAIKEGTTSASQSSLQEMVQLYFQSEEECMACEPPNIVKHSSSFLKADIKVFLQNNSATSFTSSRSIARIFHGISSPAFPSSLWSRNHFWGRYKNIDFNTIKEAVSRELAAFQGLKSKGVVPV